MKRKKNVNAAAFLRKLYSRGRESTDSPTDIQLLREEQPLSGDDTIGVSDEGMGATNAKEEVIAIVAEVREDELLLHCPTAEVAAAIEAGRSELEGAMKRIAETAGENDWPGNAVAPGEPCSQCGSLDKWWDPWGDEHCSCCEWKKVQKARRLAQRAEAARARRPCRKAEATAC